MAVTVRLQAAGLSDAGRVRENNEDRYHVDPDLGIYFVIDGVGGHAAGEKAAETAHALIRSRLERATGSVEERLREAIALANNEIFELAQSNPEWKGMACVLTVAVVTEREVALGHVGDSRCYLIEAGKIRKLTHDHSPVGEREDRGEIDEYAAMNHPRRNEVFRDVGSTEHSPDDPDFIEIVRTEFSESSALVLCSDGLSDLIGSQPIRSMVELYAGNPNVAARALVDAANQAGGKDNITVVVVEAPGFAGSVKRTKATIAVAPTKARSYTLPLALLAVLLTLASVYFLKPHWQDTHEGQKFGFGALRERRITRISSDIGTALLAAQPGDTVLVAPGTYSELIRLRSGIQLISEKPREALLRTSGIGVIASDVEGAVLEGFRILSDGSSPLLVGMRVNDSNVTVTDVEISGAQVAGIEILGESEGQYRANLITANAAVGIIVRDTAKPRLVQNVVTNNGRAGIEVAGSAQPVLLGNTIGGNGGEPVWAPNLSLESLRRVNQILPASPRLRPR